MYTCDIDCVVLGAGQGSRMLDLTGGGAKCLISVAGHPLLYYSLKILEENGFKSAIVTVPDSIKTEVTKLAERYKLDLKLDVVGINMTEEWGTLDTLRHIQDKLTGRDVLLLSADLITNASIKKVVDYHRSKACGLTVLLNKSVSDLKSRITPGSKTSKFKLERDLIGLSSDGQSLCLFQAEADVEEKVHISGKLLHAQPRFTIHSNLQDTHLYIINRLTLDEHLTNKSMSTVKGELIPRMVATQFKNKSKLSEDLPKERYSLENKEIRLRCHATVTDEPTLRVNNIPNYWQAFQLIKQNILVPSFSNHQQKEESANVHEKCHFDNSSFAAKSNVHGKTTLKCCAVGAGVVVNEKVKITNSILMDGVTVNSNVNITDCIVCEGAVISPGAEMSLCIVGAQCTVAEGKNVANQVLLDSDSMMQL